jgi:hypothetical protein
MFSQRLIGLESFLQFHFWRSSYFLNGSEAIEAAELWPAGMPLLVS